MWCSAALLGMAMMATDVDDPTKGKRLVFKDEFSGKGVPDLKAWLPEVGKIRNDELQYYTEGRAENARRENGHLVIEARKEKWEGSAVTSASLTTRKAYKYGYFEIRAQYPTGKGTWPAIWMLGEAIRLKGKDHIGWPRCGEVDIMENVGFNPKNVHFSVHTQDRNHMKGTQATKVIEVAEGWKGFHTYGLDWNPDRLVFYFDGAKMMTYDNDRKGEGTWPFDRPMYVILNLAIGGMWGGQQGVDDSIFPSQFLVDYVRIYQ